MRFFHLFLFVFIYSFSTLAAEVSCKISLGSNLREGQIHNVKKTVNGVEEEGFAVEVINDEGDVAGYINLYDLQNHRRNGRLGATLTSENADTELERMLTKSVKRVGIGPKLFASRAQAALNDRKKESGVAPYAVKNKLHVLYSDSKVDSREFEKPITHMKDLSSTTGFPGKPKGHSSAMVSRILALGIGSKEVQVLSIYRSFLDIADDKYTSRHEIRSLESLTFDQELLAIEWLHHNDLSTLAIVSGNRLFIYKMDSVIEKIESRQEFEFDSTISDVFFSSCYGRGSRIILAVGQELITLGNSPQNPSFTELSRQSLKFQIAKLTPERLDEEGAHLIVVGRGPKDSFLFSFNHD